MILSQYFRQCEVQQFVFKKFGQIKNKVSSIWLRTKFMVYD
jgi:hypothetical protein